MAYSDRIDALVTLVIGGGIAGLSTAYHLVRGEGLARDGGRVVLLERNAEAGREASAQNAAILRSFGPQAEIRALARASARFLNAPPPGFGAPFVERTGVLLLGDAERGKAWHTILESAPDRDELRAEGVRLLAPEEARALAPNVRGNFEAALLCPADGKVAIQRLIDALARKAEAEGAEIRTGRAVRRLLVEAGRVHGCVLEDGEHLEADAVVLAAGAWAGRLGAEAGSRVRLRPTRRHLAVSGLVDLARSRPVVWSESSGFYHRPEAGGAMLCICDEEEVDPDRLEVAAGMDERILARARSELTGLETTGLARLWAGIRTLTDDGRFVMGPDADVVGLHWAAGLGGHGMTCGIEVGRRVASGVRTVSGSRVTGGRTPS